MGLAEGFKAWRTNFFLAFEDKLDVVVKQVLAVDILKGLDLNEGLSLVIVGSATPDVAVAHNRFKGGGVPQLQRLGRHHVVVGVDEDGRGCGVNQPFGIDDGVTG